MQYSACSAHAFKLRGLGVHIKLIKSVVDYGVLQTRHQSPVAGTPPHFQMAGRKWINEGGRAPPSHYHGNISNSHRWLTQNPACFINIFRRHEDLQHVLIQEIVHLI